MCFQCFFPFALWHPLRLLSCWLSDCPECLIPDNLPLHPPSFPSSVSSPLRGSLLLSSFLRRQESSSLPVTANATPKRSLPICIPEKDTPLLNCCQRITGALFKPFAELLPKQSPVSGPIPSQTPPHQDSMSVMFTVSLCSYMPTLAIQRLTMNHPCALCARIQCYPTCITRVLPKKSKRRAKFNENHQSPYLSHF